MLTETQVAQFRSKGFLNGGQVLNDDQVEVLRDELMRVIEQHDSLPHKPVMFRNLSRQADAPVWQILNIWEASEPFRDLMCYPKITEEIAQLTDATELRIWHDQIQYKPAETGGVNMWHQDAPKWHIIRPMTEVSAWVALDNVDESNGCMSMVPGSHLWGDQISFLSALTNFHGLPPEFNGHEVRVELCPVRQGEVHYHHGLTWHDSHANTSARPRRAIAFHYMTQETRYVASGEHPMKPFVEVADGEFLQGEHFPVVWSLNSKTV